ncbi:MAG: hypothetical protein PQJ59_10290 [Spirochaetales bacterium]|nr:hypothetical protein [Spirochaetales bacterium]
MNLKKAKAFLLFFMMSFFLYGGGILEGKEEEEVPTVQELYEEMDEALPVVGFYAPQFRVGVDEEEAERIFLDITETLVHRGTFKPGNLEEWMAAEYASQSPPGIIELNQAVERAQISLDYTASVNILPFKNQYLFRMAFYKPGRPHRTVYVYRILNNLENDWDKNRDGILDELDYRLAHNDGTFLSDTIYVEPFKVRFFDYYELKNREYAFTELPFLTMDGRDYRLGDDLFSEWLGLRLHLSGYFPVVIHDMDERVEGTDRPPECTWGIKGEVRVSKVFSILKLTVYNYPRQEVVGEYDFPFDSLRIKDVSKVIDSMIPFIMDRVLSNEVRRNMITVDPKFKFKHGTQVYRESGYQGPLNLIGCYPVEIGMNRFLVEKDNFRPYDLSGFNETLLVSPTGEVFHSYTKKEVNYGEKLFE